MIRVISNINDIILMIITIIFLKSLLSKFLKIVFLKVMFECVEASCTFNFFGDVILQSRTNQR